jgi:hypothetical protein
MNINNSDLAKLKSSIANSAQELEHIPEFKFGNVDDKLVKEKLRPLLNTLKELLQDIEVVNNNTFARVEVL